MDTYICKYKELLKVQQGINKDDVIEEFTLYPNDMIYIPNGRITAQLLRIQDVQLVLLLKMICLIA